jgi:hypothetical protein
VNPAIVKVDFGPDVYKVPSSCIGCHDEPTLIAEDQTRRHVNYAELSADTLPASEDFNWIFKPTCGIKGKREFAVFPCEKISEIELSIKSNVMSSLLSLEFRFFIIPK